MQTCAKGVTGLQRERLIEKTHRLVKEVSGAPVPAIHWPTFPLLTSAWDCRPLQLGLAAQNGNVCYQPALFSIHSRTRAGRNTGDFLLSRLSVLAPPRSPVVFVPQGWVECFSCNRKNHQTCGLFNAKAHPGSGHSWRCAECILKSKKKKEPGGT